MANTVIDLIKAWRFPRQSAPLAVIGLMLLIGIIYPWLTPYEVSDFSAEALMPPGRAHLLGTNNLGQDIYTLVLAGFRVSAVIALISAALSTLTGILFAGIATFYRGLPEKFTARLTDLLVIIPEIVFILVFATFAGPSLVGIVVAIAMFSWARVTRILKARTDIAINSDRVKYTVLLKGGLFEVVRKMWRDIYPAIATMFVLQCAKAVTYEADLSLLGLSSPTVMTWGRLIRQAIDYGMANPGGFIPWWLLPPVCCLVLLVATLSFLAFEEE